MNWTPSVPYKVGEVIQAPLRKPRWWRFIARRKWRKAGGIGYFRVTHQGVSSTKEPL